MQDCGVKYAVLCEGLASNESLKHLGIYATNARTAIKILKAISTKKSLTSLSLTVTSWLPFSSQIVA